MTDAVSQATDHEYVDAYRLAVHVLDRPHGDPDDDLAVLARQFLRACERNDRRRGALRVLIEHIEHIPYRDAAGLRLGDTVPHFERAKEALKS